MDKRPADRWGEGGGVLTKVLYREAPPQGPTPHPLMCHFRILLVVPLSHTLFTTYLKFQSRVN